MPEGPPRVREVQRRSKKGCTRCGRCYRCEINIELDGFTVEQTQSSGSGSRRLAREAKRLTRAARRTIRPSGTASVTIDDRSELSPVRIRLSSADRTTLANTCETCQILRREGNRSRLCLACALVAGNRDFANCQLTADSEEHLESVQLTLVPLLPDGNFVPSELKPVDNELDKPLFVHERRLKIRREARERNMQLRQEHHHLLETSSDSDSSVSDEDQGQFNGRPQSAVQNMRSDQTAPTGAKKRKR